MIDLRSDTVTKPTPAMRRAMAEAEVGDDVFGEDPTIRRLQAAAAELLGQEASLFVPSGTMGNQIAIQIHTKPGQQIIAEARAHIFEWELGAIATYAGCEPRPIFSGNGHITWEEIESAINPPAYYRSPTGLIVLENTHNMAGGIVLTEDEVTEITDQARRRQLRIHLDGARIFHTAIALDCSVASLTSHFDSVMVCLSKGLCAPVGSILAGSRVFIEEALRVRKRMGGGMRQTGILAAAGLIALQQMIPRLAEDHQKARRLAQGISKCRNLTVYPERVQTNIVMAKVHGQSSSVLTDSLARQGVLAVPTGPQEVRFVTHHDVSMESINTAVQAVRMSFPE